MNDDAWNHEREDAACVITDFWNVTPNNFAETC
jgi:hypothetical protein